MLSSTTLNTRRQQRGITLIEVSIGLIIAAIIAAAAFIAFQNNARRSETQDNIKVITEYIAETKQKFGLTTGYTAGDFRAQAFQAGVLPVAAPANSYGGVIALNGINANSAVMTWPSVEEDQCLDIVLNAQDGVLAIGSVDGAAITAGTAVPTADAARVHVSANGPLTAAEATALCQSATDVVSLEFYFGRR